AVGDGGVLGRVALRVLDVDLEAGGRDGLLEGRAVTVLPAGRRSRVGKDHARTTSGVSAAVAPRSSGIVGVGVRGRTAGQDQCRRGSEDRRRLKGVLLPHVTPLCVLILDPPRTPPRCEGYLTLARRVSRMLYQMGTVWQRKVSNRFIGIYEDIRCPQPRRGRKMGPRALDEASSQRAKLANERPVSPAGRTAGAGSRRGRRRPRECCRGRATAAPSPRRRSAAGWAGRSGDPSARRCRPRRAPCPPRAGRSRRGRTTRRP